MDLQLFGLLDITNHPDVKARCRVSIAVATLSLRNVTDLAETSVEPAVIGRLRALGGCIQQRCISCSNYSMMYIPETRSSRLLHLAMLPFLIPSFYSVARQTRGQRRLADTWLPQPGSSSSRFLPSITLALSIFADVDLIRAQLWC